MNRDVVQEGVQWLTGRRAGVRYGRLKSLLADADAQEVSRDGSHRTWKHPAVPDLLTIPEGSGDVLPVYIRKTRKYLQEILRQG